MPFRQIATVIGRRLGVPAEGVGQIAALRRFGVMLPYVSRDAPATGAWTRDILGWTPCGPGLLGDLDRPEYFGPRPPPGR